MKKATAIYALQDKTELNHEISRLLEMYYRAEIAEALIIGEAPKPYVGRDPESASSDRPRVAELVLGSTKKLDRRAKHGLVRRLVRRDLRTGELLQPRDQAQIRKALRGDRSIPMAVRLRLVDQLVELLRPDKPVEPDDIDGHRDWLTELTAQLLPAGVATAMHIHGHDDDDPNGGSAPPITYDSLRFEIERLECLSTTNEIGRDEMSLRSIGMDGEASVSLNTPLNSGGVLGPRHDCGQFSRGDVNDFTPDLVANTWSSVDAALPHVFVAFLVAAETDPGGGFDGYMNDLLGSLFAEMATVWSDVAIVLGWTSVMASVGLVGGPIGFAITSIVAGVAATFVLISIAITENRDDVFDPLMVVLSLDEDGLAGEPFFGSDRTPTESARIFGDGGIYDLAFHWRITI